MKKTCYSTQWRKKNVKSVTLVAITECSMISAKLVNLRDMLIWLMSSKNSLKNKNSKNKEDSKFKQPKKDTFNKKSNESA